MIASLKVSLSLKANGQLLEIKAGNDIEKP